MARRKAPRPARPANQPPTQPHHHEAPPPTGGTPSTGGTTRRFLNRGVQVEISEPSGAEGLTRGAVALTLDGVPIEVSVDHGEYFAHVAHMFTGFGSMDALVDHLLAHEGRTWTLHGHVCDDQCRGGHHHAHGPGHGHDHPPDHHGQDPVTGDHPHVPGGGEDHHGDHHAHLAAPRRPRTRRGGAR